MIFALIITLTYGLQITNLDHNLLRAPHQYGMNYYGRLVSFCSRNPYSPYCQKFYGDAEDAFKYAYGAFGGYGQYGMDGGYGGFNPMGLPSAGGMSGTPQSSSQCQQFMQRNGFRYQQGVMTDSDSAAFKRMANMFQMCQMMVSYGSQGSGSATSEQTGSQAASGATGEAAATPQLY